MVANNEYVFSSWGKWGFHTVMIWKKCNGTFSLHQEIKNPHELAIKGLAVDGNLLASISDKTVKIWKQTIEGQYEELQTLPVCINKSVFVDKNYYFSVQLKDGLLFSAHYGCVVWKSSIDEQFVKHQELVQCKDVNSISVNEDTLFVGVNSHKIKVFKKNVNNEFDETLSLKPFTCYTHIALTTDFLAYGSGDFYVRIWQKKENGNFKLEQFFSQNSLVRCIASKDDTLAIGLYSGKVQIWNKEKGAFVGGASTFFEGVPTSCVFSDDKLLVTVKDVIKVWDFFQSKQETVTLPS